MVSKFTFRDELRRAIRQSGLTVYRIAKETGTHEPQLYRFMSGERGLSIESIEAICSLLGLRLVTTAKPQRKTKTTKGR